MKKVISLLLAVVIIFAIAAAPLEASAYSVGEEIAFEVGTLSGSSGGSGSHDTRTEEQKDIDWKNEQATNNINGIVGVWIEEVTSSPYWYQIGDPDPGVKVVAKNIWTTKQDLECILEQLKKYNPGYKVTWDEEYIIVDYPDIPQGGEEEDFFNDKIKDIDNIPDNPLYKRDKYDNEYWVDGWWDDYWEYKKAIKDSIEEREIELLVPTFPGSIWVCKTKEETARCLQDYITEKSIYTENMNVVYVKQYNIQETIKGAVWQETPRLWYGSAHSHLMEYDYIPEPGSTDIQTLTELRTPIHNTETGKKEISKVLNHKGTYHVTATQIMEKKYWDMLTYTTSEYLILPETGMVIWQRHSVGGTSNNNDAYFQQAYHWLKNACYYKHVDTKTFYVPVMEKDIVVDGVDADKSKWKPNTPFGNIFTTVRIR